MSHHTCRKCGGKIQTTEPKESNSAMVGPPPSSAVGDSKTALKFVISGAVAHITGLWKVAPTLDLDKETILNKISSAIINLRKVAPDWQAVFFPFYSWFQQNFPTSPTPKIEQSMVDQIYTFWLENRTNPKIGWAAATTILLSIFYMGFRRKWHIAAKDYAIKTRANMDLVKSMKYWKDRVAKARMASPTSSVFDVFDADADTDDETL